MSGVYNEWILDHYRNPRNCGELNNPDVSLQDTNQACGDRIRLDLKIKDGRISDARFSGEGCILSIAAASILMETITGALVDDVRSIDTHAFAEILGVPIKPSRSGCAFLAVRVLRRAMKFE